MMREGKVRIIYFLFLQVWTIVDWMITPTNPHFHWKLLFRCRFGHISVWFGWNILVGFGVGHIFLVSPLKTKREKEIANIV